MEITPKVRSDKLIDIKLKKHEIDMFITYCLSNGHKDIANILTKQAEGYTRNYALQYSRQLKKKWRE